LIDHPSDDLPQGQLALPRGAEGRDDAQLPGRLLEGPNRSDGYTLAECHIRLEVAELLQIAFVA